MNQPEEELSPAEISAIFGDHVEEAHPDPREIEVALTLDKIRDLLKEAAEEESVGINDLARRLDVAPSSVSRFFSSEGDMRVSTIVLYALALGRSFHPSLSHAHVHGSNSLHMHVVQDHGWPGSATTTAGPEVSQVNLQPFGVKLKVVGGAGQ